MKIRQGVTRFRHEVLADHADRFRQLAQGQNPEVLFITCSDSRIDPALVTQSLPGELFVIRNAGNLVPTRRGSGVAATVEYGVRALGVKHLVVCGHSHCGAIAAALDPDSLGEFPYVAAWLREAGPDLSGLEAEGDDRLKAAVELNVLRQLDNLRSLPSVAAALEAGKVELHGWTYRFETGEIFEYDVSTARFAPLSTAKD